MSEQVNVLKVPLTPDQVRVIVRQLPKGYQIVPLNRPNKRESSRNVLAKQVSSDSDQVARQRKKPVQKAPVYNDEDLASRAPKTFTPEQKKCFLIMQKLRRHPAAYLFFRPQENWKNNDIVQEYIDFLMIDQNVKNGAYSSILQFWADVRKIWQCSYLTNPKDSEMYARTIEMETFFDELYREAEKPIQKNNFNDLQKKVDKLTKELNMISQQKVQTPVHHAPPPVAKRPPQQYVPPVRPSKNKSKASKSQSKLEIPMTIQEKKILGMNIRSLPPECLKGVWEIVSEGLDVQNNSEELEFDIDTLPVKKTRLLERYVNNKLQQLNRQSQKSQVPQTHQVSNETLKQPATTAPQNYWPLANPPENDTAESSFSSDPDDSI